MRTQGVGGNWFFKPKQYMSGFADPTGSREGRWFANVPLQFNIYRYLDSVLTEIQFTAIKMFLVLIASTVDRSRYWTGTVTVASPMSAGLTTTQVTTTRSVTWNC